MDVKGYPRSDGRGARGGHAMCRLVRSEVVRGTARRDPLRLRAARGGVSEFKSLRGEVIVSTKTGTTLHESGSDAPAAGGSVTARIGGAAAARAVVTVAQRP